MQAIANMSFEEFAEIVKPTCGINRIAANVPGAEDQYSYSVYLNGALAESLPEKLRQMHTKDVMINSLTEKCSLNPNSFRDNARMLELVATRNAYLGAVFELTSRSHAVSQFVHDEYAVLTRGLTHPYLVHEIYQQQLISSGLKPALDKTSELVGKQVVDKPPREVSKGKVVSQSNDFTFQELMNGDVAVHENRRLNEVPIIGGEVTIVYYNGLGQVFSEKEKLRVSSPYIDGSSNELAVALIDEHDKAVKVVKFKGVSTYAKFIGEHELDDKLIEQAVILSSESKKREAEVTSLRMPVSNVYIDQKSGCLGLDYKESGMVYSVLFTDAASLAISAKSYGMTADHIGKAKALQIQQTPISQAMIDNSMLELAQELKKNGVKGVADSGKEGQVFSGSVVAESKLHIAQDNGRGMVQVYDKRSLDKLPGKGDSFTVRMGKEMGLVDTLDRAKSQKIAR